jgi:hypothetical protein
VSRPDFNPHAEWAVWSKRHNHVIPEQKGYTYPCRGCGVETNQAGVDRPCTKPYSDPQGIEAVLVEIRDLLKVLVERGSRHEPAAEPADHMPPHSWSAERWRRFLAEPGRQRLTDVEKALGLSHKTIDSYLNAVGVVPVWRRGRSGSA